MKIETSLEPSLLCIGTKLEKVACLGKVMKSVMSGRVTILIGIRVWVAATSLNRFLSDVAMSR